MFSNLCSTCKGILQIYEQEPSELIILEICQNISLRHRNTLLEMIQFFYP